MGKAWFEELFGFRERGYETVKKNLEMRDGKLVSLANGREFQPGEFLTPSLAELRQQVQEIVPKPSEEGCRLKLSHIAVSDIYATHMEKEYAGAMFQVASQFNCLEFVSPGVVPENGITGYASDHTQGPACSLACPAGTAYRNYFATTPKGNEGQRSDDQINNLDDIEAIINNPERRYWITRNGYVNSTPHRLSVFNKLLRKGQWDHEQLLTSLKIGLQLETEVIQTMETRQKSVQLVNQAFCSGISVSYSQAGGDDWELIARLVLDAAYECVILAALLQLAKGKGSKIVMLTFIGGGVFGNRLEWITHSIARACALYATYELDVRVCHYRRVDTNTAATIDEEFKSLQ